MEKKSVLVTYLERNKVLCIESLNDEEDLKILEGEFRQQFKLESATDLSVTFQRFDADWGEYVELDHSSALHFKDKLKAVTTPTPSDFGVSLDGGCSDKVQVTTVSFIAFLNPISTLKLANNTISARLHCRYSRHNVFFVKLTLLLLYVHCTFFKYLLYIQDSTALSTPLSRKRHRNIIHSDEDSDTEFDHEKSSENVPSEEVIFSKVHKSPVIESNKNDSVTGATRKKPKFEKSADDAIPLPDPFPSFM